LTRGSQFTSEAFTGALRAYDIRISMDGKGRWIDNVMVEKLWRSLKCEEVYLRAYETVAEARESITTYFRHFNEERRHQSLGNRTSDEVYFTTQTAAQAA
jgi:putative transposase